MKSSNFARTNEFEVTERLEGLQEKFQIFNNDELADALHKRLVKLKQPPEKWLPDILDLLLRLSDNPTKKIRIEWLVDIGNRSAVVPSLTWADIEADDPVDRCDDIWTAARYSELSSDDDVVEVTPRIPTSDGKISISKEQELCLQANFEPLDLDSGLKALNRLREAQFWRNVSTASYELIELQVIREILFML